MFDNVVEEFSSRDVLHYHKYISGCTDNLIKPDNVGMLEKSQILYLSPDFPHHVQTFDFLTIQNLHRYFVTSHLMKPN